IEEAPLVARPLTDCSHRGSHSRSRSPVPRLRPCIPRDHLEIQVMKTLFLIRHAKSSWDDTALPDKDRPLGDRGRRDAPKMGKRLAKRDVKPDLILSSPATRALKTAEIIAKKLDYKRKDLVCRLLLEKKKKT